MMTEIEITGAILFYGVIFGGCAVVALIAWLAWDCRDL